MNKYNFRIHALYRDYLSEKEKIDKKHDKTEKFLSIFFLSFFVILAFALLYLSVINQMCYIIDPYDPDDYANDYYHTRNCECFERNDSYKMKMSLAVDWGYEDCPDCNPEENNLQTKISSACAVPYFFLTAWFSGRVIKTYSTYCEHKTKELLLKTKVEIYENKHSLDNEYFYENRDDPSYFYNKRNAYDGETKYIFEQLGIRI